MTRRNKNSLPSVDEKPSSQFAEMKKEVDQKVIESHGAPANAIEGYLPRRVDVKLTRAQATILRDKLRELEDTGAKTADGRLVASRRQAVQWIIENEVT